MGANQVKLVYITVLALIWGSSFILIKRGLDGLSALQVGSLRMVCASTFLLLIGFRTLPKIPSEKWKFIAITAFVGSFLPAFLFAIAQTHISSTVSAIMNALTPLNTLIIGVLLFALDYKRNQVFGVVVGLVGSALLIFGGSSGHDGNNWFAFLAFLGALCYAINVNLVKKYLADLSPLAITAGNFAVLFVPALIILFATGYLNVIELPKIQTSTAFVALLGVMGTGIANLIFYRLIKISTPVFAASVTYLIPIVAFFWGLYDGESLSLSQFIGALIVLLGVYLSSRK